MLPVEITKLNIWVKEDAINVNVNDNFKREVGIPSRPSALPRGISAKKHLPIKQTRNQESQAEKNHILLPLRNRFSLSENHEVASHELQIRSYLERSGSMFEQTVQFTVLSNIHATCSLSINLREKSKSFESYFSTDCTPWRYNLKIIFGNFA